MTWLNYGASKAFGRKQSYVWLCLAAALLVVLIVPLLAGCQFGGSYPSKPILFVVPYAPGGGSDIMVRALDNIAQKHKIFPHPFAIENKSGGNGVVGKSYALSKPADGYTIVVVDDGNFYQPLLGEAPWTHKDFTYIARMVVDYNMVVVRSESPFKTLKELIDAAKQKPKSIKIAGTGTGGTDQTQLGQLSQLMGVEFTYVPFNSGGEVMTNLLGGHVDAAMANPSEAYSQMQAGKVRSLGISAPSRLADLPDIPTWKEQGIDLVVSQWRGIGGHKNMPKNAVDYLVANFKKIVETQDWKIDYLKKFQQADGFLTGQELEKQIEKEYAAAEEIFIKLGLIKKK